MLFFLVSKVCTISVFCVTEDVAEAEHDIWREVDGQRSLLRNQLQCGVHSSTGKKKYTSSFVCCTLSTVQVHFSKQRFCSCLQGLEIVNPQAAEKKVAEANQKYFSNMAEFLKVKKEAKM